MPGSSICKHNRRAAGASARMRKLSSETSRNCTAFTRHELPTPFRPHHDSMHLFVTAVVAFLVQVQYCTHPQTSRHASGDHIFCHQSVTALLDQFVTFRLCNTNVTLVCRSNFLSVPSTSRWMHLFSVHALYPRRWFSTPTGSSSQAIPQGHHQRLDLPLYLVSSVCLHA